VPAITPEQLLEAPQYLAIDIRPLPERLGELGFLPGSLSIPMPSFEYASQALLDARLAGDELVLYCASGNRSGRLLAQLERTLERPVHHLDGGILAWQAAGLPTAYADPTVLDEHDRGVSEARTFRRLLMSCFVAEATEVVPDDDELIVASEPLTVLRRCFEVSGTDWDETDPARLYTVVDHASVVFRKLGGPLDRIAYNMSRMYAVLDRLGASDALAHSR
jgi:rhodanese-related sulfurtransferase